MNNILNLQETVENNSFFLKARSHEKILPVGSQQICQTLVAVGTGTETGNFICCHIDMTAIVTTVGRGNLLRCVSIITSKRNFDKIISFFVVNI